MNNLNGKKPLGIKAAKAVKNKKHLKKIGGLRCCICEKFSMPQLSPTQVHHVIHDRFSTKKACDLETIPLCEGHHQGMFDTTKIAIHRSKTKWRELYGPDWSYLSKDHPTEF